MKKQWSIALMILLILSVLTACQTKEEDSVAVQNVLNSALKAVQNGDEDATKNYTEDQKPLISYSEHTLMMRFLPAQIKEFQKEIKKLLKDFSYTIQDVHIEDNTATIRLDIQANDLGGRITHILENAKSINDVFQLRSLFNKDIPKTEKTIEVTLVKVDDTWKIAKDNEALKNALSGFIDDANINRASEKFAQNIESQVTSALDK